MEFTITNSRFDYIDPDADEPMTVELLQLIEAGNQTLAIVRISDDGTRFIVVNARLKWGD